VKILNLMNCLERPTPSFRSDVAKNTRDMDKVLVPQLEPRIQALGREDKEERNTIMDIAFKFIRSDNEKGRCRLQEKELRKELDDVWDQILRKRWPFGQRSHTR
jgi:hypothetical protein